MTTGSIIRHDCVRLIIYGQRCACSPVEPFFCDCSASGNHEFEGAGCRAHRRRVWNHVVNWARDRAQSSP